ncbi:hypothetical protein GH714_024305 [Hevea brasiliensis]|uniref:Laccase n=1 Tax=Hevea brasiliensis TaxID=3981 RepID=A0A6A6LB18_HEVBR|nr:hypothetical protein GH714_024305 [Hevea brasiliensis]
MVDYGRTYLLRIINAVVQDMVFLSIAGHNFTVVGTDASYTKPLTADYITISPGQTIDVLLEANQPPNHYYMAARVYSAVNGLPIDNTTTTAIIQYNGNYTPFSPPLLPNLPYYNDTSASVNFTASLRSLADKEHPVNVPLNISTRMFITISINTFPCQNDSCAGPNGTRLAASLNNISFVHQSIDVLEAYYYRRNGVFGSKFPNFPPLVFNFTGASDHPMHLHGFSFYVIGRGLGNFDKDKDPLGYNLVDPPLQNTIAVPINGWTTIRFKADNPGVWFMHCHLDRHMTWGMDTVFIVKDGEAPQARMLPPPPDMPPC